MVSTKTRSQRNHTSHQMSVFRKKINFFVLFFLLAIKKILEGQKTRTFKKGCQQPSLEKASFSIIPNIKIKENTIDLVAKGIDEKKMWVKALKTLVKKYAMS